MKLLISAIVWENMLKNGMKQLDLIDIATECGCMGVEFRPYWQNPVQEIPLIRQALAKKKLICTYACNEFLLDQTQEGVQQSLKNMAESINLAKELGAEFLRIHVSAGTFDSSLLTENWWQQAIKEVIGLAKTAGIKLVLENPSDKQGGNPALIKDIITAFSSPWLLTTFDTGNWLPAGYNPANALTILSDFIGYIHLKDIIAENDRFSACRLGAGGIDFPGLLKTLSSLGYTGLYALEFPGGSDPLASIKSSLNYLNGLQQN